MKILFLTDNYPPEVNAPAVRTHVHCRTWARSGADVTVITCAPNFPRGEVFGGYRNRLWQTEVVDGVRVIRVWSYMAPNRGFARRIADYLSFAVSGTLAAAGRDFDVVVATSPQFFTALAGSVVASLRARPWVFELRDLWPESIVATGAMKRGFAVEALEHLEMTLYRSADLVVPVTHAFRRQLGERGIPLSKVHVVTNGVDREEFTPESSAAEARLPSEDAAREARAPTGDRPLRVGYLGTHGLAHGLDLVLRAAALLDPSEAEFVLVGDGAEKPGLVARARELGLPHVRFEEAVSRDRVPATLRSFDAALVPLRDSPTFQSVIPSKIFEAAAVGRPILLGVRGEARAIVDEHGAGLTFTPEDEAGLAAAIRRLRSRPGLYARLQEGGARLAEAYDRDVLAHRMLAHLRALAGSR